MVEAKMMGTPKHPGSEAAKAEGRRGPADMLKRCKEGGFKTIDLKGGYGYKLSQAGGGQQQTMSGDLTTWLRSTSASPEVRRASAGSDRDPTAPRALV
jgi:hypothetical protein